MLYNIQDIFDPCFPISVEFHDVCVEPLSGVAQHR